MNAIKTTDLMFSAENRKNFDTQKFADLVASIKEKGIITPLLVRPKGKTDSGPLARATYEVIAGERRLRAANELKMKEVPCTVRNMTDEEAAQIRIIENLQREDVGAIDEAEGYDLMAKKYKFTMDALASKVGKSVSYISGRMKLLSLPQEIKKAISEGIISPGHGLVLSRVKDAGEQKELCKAIIHDKLSVNAAENALSRTGFRLSDARFDTGDCEGCESNGTRQKDLFDKATNIKGRCMNAKCFMDKSSAGLNKKRDELIKKGYRVEIEEKLKNKIKGYESYHTAEIGQGERSVKKYAEKCLTCKDRIYVIENDGYNSGGIKHIVERCLKPSCLRSYGSQSTEDRSGNRAKAKKIKRVREAKRTFWINALVNKKDPVVIRSIIADIVLGDIGGHGNEIMKKYVMKAPQYGHYTIPNLHALGEKKLDQIIQDAICEKIWQLYSDDHLKYLSESIGAVVAKQWIITKEYLNSAGKPDLVRIDKELDLGLKLEESMKKSDMMKKILDTGTTKIPREITGK